MLNCKYFLYVRKSSESEDRQIQSIDNQISVLKNISKDRGLKLLEIFSESRSAKSPGRPIFNSMIERIKNGEANGIITWKLDRLSRNPIDSGTISWLLQSDIIKHIQTSDRSYYPEDNILMMSVEQGMANQFIRDLSSNTKRGLLQKATRGWYPAQPTLGYAPNPNKKKGDKEIIKDPASYDIVRKMFDLMLTGAYNPREILEKATNEWGLKKRNGKEVARSTIYRIFKDPFYFGRFEYPVGSGNFFNGAHEPMITFNEFQKIQQLLKRSTNKKAVKYSFKYTGLIKCEECGAAITAEHKYKYQKNGNVHHYIYYHCTKQKNPNCSQKKVIDERKLEEQIIHYFEKLIVPEEIIRWIIEQMDSEISVNKKRNESIKTNLKKELKRIDLKLNNLLEMKLAGEIDATLFLNKKEELNSRKESFTNHLEELEKKGTSKTEEVQKLFDFSNNLVKKFNNSGDLKKREILSVLSSNLSMLDQKLNISFQKPINYIFELREDVKNNFDTNKEIRTNKSPDKTRTYEVENQVSPVWLRE